MHIRYLAIAILVGCGGLAQAADDASAKKVEEVVVTAQYDGHTLADELLAAAKPTLDTPAITVALAGPKPAPLQLRSPSADSASN